MKRYLAALVIGGLLIVMPAVGSTAQQTGGGVEQKLPAVEEVKKPLQHSVEFTTSLEEITKGTVKNITRDQLANAVINKLESKGIILNEITNRQYTNLELLYRLGMMPSDWDTEQLDAPVAKEEIDYLVERLAATEETESGTKNIHGVSYNLIPQRDSAYMLEMTWGSKPSSGYVIEIKDVVVNQGSLYVTYTTREPQAGSAYLTVITHPRDAKLIETNRQIEQVITILVD
ncbi:protease complex subunit PrcB family protein [Desulfofalx alkaliphila]|uniref:protease complex subunit PrcB family protein n=1 Tax=Desulfofalx alkaliphila TaxID=105483 RepID=UPI0004E1CDAF|nr:protease complex subunit PrcB family protein [Desulfofalx alkaliphila]